jgi:isopentenyl-diphosphate delta-isomerase
LYQAGYHAGKEPRYNIGVMQTPEKIDVLDDNGLRTGEVCSKQTVHALGKVHRAVHLYLFNYANQLLLQRRASTTDHYPGKFSISVTGHVQAGESSSDAVRRELQEELGLDPTSMDIEYLFSFRQDAEISPTYIDRQFNDVYVCQADFKLQECVLETNAVSKLRLVPFSAFQAMVADEKGALAPGYARECSDLIYFLQNKPLL